MFGFGTIISPGADGCNATTFKCPEKGGLYTNIGGDVIFHKRLGFGFDTAWKASQGAPTAAPVASPSAPSFLTSMACINPD